MTVAPETLHSVFVSYSHKDEAWKDLLLSQLGSLVEGRQVAPWHDRMISPGDEWYDQIRDAMGRATLSICLLSPDFLTSDFCTREEMAYLLERRRRDGLRIVPVLVRPCSWQRVPWLKALQLLPLNGKAIEAFAGREREAFAEVAASVSGILADPAYQPSPAPVSEWPPLDEQSINIDTLPITGYELFGRRLQLQNLDLAWKSPGTRVIALVGRGGVGKSTLVRKWLEQMEGDNFRGAGRVFGWSFHGQGSGERVASGHDFIVTALSWFGDADPDSGSPWDKAERLADHIRRHRTLLVLDGLEPLQSESVVERGRVKDPAISALLTELALDSNGLCVVTTREPILDLQEFGDAALQETLERVSVDAGRAILRVGGVVGRDRALEELSAQFGCDALALKLLAAYIRGTPTRGVAEALQIAESDVAEERGRDARRVLAAFERRWEGRAEADLVRMLGFFDGPALAPQLAALRSETAISDLTERVATVDEAAWLRLLDAVRDHGLITFDEQTGDVDTHPIIREHFAAVVRDRFPAAWSEGHRRLYEHLTRSTAWQPDTLEGMMPLLKAVTHGCQAGQWQDAATNVFFERVQRQREDFSTVWLGASGPVLAALASFFTERWKQLMPFPRAKEAYILSQASGCLDRLGRFAEAVEVSLRSLEIDLAIAGAATSARARENYLVAAGMDANNIAEHLLVLGPVSEAGGAAREALGMVHQTGNRFWWVVTLTTIAEAYHLMNHIEKAAECFAQAEELHGSLGRHLPTLYARQGFRYCSFLNDQGRYEDVVARARRNVEVQDNWPIDTALDHLSLGRAHLGLGEVSAAEGHLREAIDGVRNTGQSEFIPKCLLARAELRRAQDDRQRARGDAERALRLTQWQGARLAETDARLFRASMLVEEGEVERARIDLQAAARLIEATDYHLRAPRLHDLERNIAS